VLVGHSLGGLYAANYARRFPKDVAGLVLVDPTFSSPETRPKTAQERAEVDAANAQASAPFVRCAELAEQRVLTRQDTKGCFTLPPGLDDATVSYLLPTMTGPGRWRAMVSEIAVSASPNETMNVSFGNLPLIVLTHGAPLRLPMDTDASFAARTAMIVRAHEAIAAQSTRGRDIVVPGAGHYIQNDKPEAVAAAITQVLAQARKQ
jgi:pimeloyl-ACP methyl ester carboxylesterase